MKRTKAGESADVSDGTASMPRAYAYIYIRPSVGIPSIKKLAVYKKGATRKSTGGKWPGDLRNDVEFDPRRPGASHSKRFCCRV